MGALPAILRSGGRVVEGARLESEYTPKAYRGFESLPLRHLQPNPANAPLHLATSPTLDARQAPRESRTGEGLGVRCPGRLCAIAVNNRMASRRPKAWGVEKQRKRRTGS